MGIRSFVYGLVTSDPTMNGYGINADTVWANGAPDSPQSEVFGILRWGLESNQGVGRQAKGHDVALWVYDSNADYTRIRQILKRWHALVESIPGQFTTDGWVLGITWEGDGRDDYDEVYARYMRDSNYTIVASGD